MITALGTADEGQRGVTARRGMPAGAAGGVQQVRWEGARVWVLLADQRPWDQGSPLSTLRCISPGLSSGSCPGVRGRKSCRSPGQGPPLPPRPGLLWAGVASFS